MAKRNGQRIWSTGKMWNSIFPELKIFGDRVEELNLYPTAGDKVVCELRVYGPMDANGYREEHFHGVYWVPKTMAYQDVNRGLIAWIHRTRGEN